MNKGIVVFSHVTDMFCFKRVRRLFSDVNFNQYIYNMGLLGGIIGSAVGAAGNIFGGIGKNKALKRQAAMVEDAKRENQNWFDRRYNEDFTQRADAQAILAQTAEALRQRNRNAAGREAVMGGSTEAVAAEKQANANVMAKAASAIASAGAAHKDNLERQYLSTKAALDGNLRDIKASKQSFWDILGGATGGAASGFGAGSEIENYIDQV